MSKLSRRELRKYINSLTVEEFADNYAYVFQADLDRIYFFASDKKENRKFYTDKLIDEIFESNERMRTVILTDLGYLKKSSIKKSIKMATKKPTAKQLAARKKFAAMAKSGELAKKREAASKKTTANSAKLLVISSKNPLSTQLKKITGDQFSTIDFEEIESNSEYAVIKHKKTGKYYAYVTERYFENLNTQFKKRLIEKLKSKYNFSSLTVHKTGLAKPSNKPRKRLQTGSTDVYTDKMHKAKKPGKRVSAIGNTYYERRANRSDVGKLLSPLNGKTAPGMTKFAAKNVHVEGVKRDGTLKKGYKYVTGGKIVKVKKATAKK